MKKKYEIELTEIDKLTKKFKELHTEFYLKISNICAVMPNINFERFLEQIKAENFIKYTSKDELQNVIDLVLKITNTALENTNPLMNIFENLVITNENKIKEQLRLNNESGNIDVVFNIQSDVYKNKMKYPSKKEFLDTNGICNKDAYNKAISEYHAEDAKNYENFKSDCFKSFQISGEKAEKAFMKAWNNKISEGVYAVYQELGDLVDLIK